MNILVTGKGSSGSWQVRGVQLGGAIGARVVPKAEDFRGFDCVIMVKRPAPGMVEAIHAAGVPLVWDIVDAWPQPVGNDWTRDECIQWLRRSVADVRPHAIVAATKAMSWDLLEFNVPTLVLPHHARPGLARNPIRERVQNVGYEGGVQYLGRWLETLHLQCKRRGWVFHVNPPALADLDIVVALRDATGYAPRNWKSNVKLANAQGSGTPCVLNTEAGYRETACTAELWADDALELHVAFDALDNRGIRQWASDQLMLCAPTLESTAGTYRAWLDLVCKTPPRS